MIWLIYNKNLFAMHKTIFKHLDLIEYKHAWNIQEEVFNGLISGKKNQDASINHHLFFCEHPHVYTLGKSGAENNLLINDDFLKKINASYYKTNRGGDITYHGPGQIVGYPIFDIERMKLGLKEYIFKLEEAIISCMADYNIVCDRLDGATGVWLDKDNPQQARKICAIGVRASRYVTMHGFALNVNTDLSYFNHINPCGFVDKGVTSMQKELNKELSTQEVEGKLLSKIAAFFNLEIEKQ